MVKVCQRMENKCVGTNFQEKRRYNELQCIQRSETVGACYEGGGKGVGEAITTRKVEKFKYLGVAFTSDGTQDE